LRSGRPAACARTRRRSPRRPDTAELHATADALEDAIRQGDPEHTKALLRILIQELRVSSRAEILPTYRLATPLVCATTSSVALVGTLSNPEVIERVERLAKKLQELAASGAPARALRQPPKRRCGDVSGMVVQVLAEAQAPMRVVQIHEAVQAQLGVFVPRSTVKDCLAQHARPGGRFVRIARGRYCIHP
jgi:hypothetical protein